MKCNVAIFLISLTAFLATADRAIPDLIIDLSRAPEDRWTKIISTIAQEPKRIAAFADITTSSKQVLNSIGCTGECFEIISNAFQKKFPSEYGEIHGLARAFNAHGVNVTVDFLCALQYTYELWHVYQTHGGINDQPEPFGCTSVAACSRSGEVLHSRNLDWRSPQEAWKLATMHLTFLKDGATQFESTHFLGSTGTTTGVRKGGFSCSINWRKNFFDLSQTLDCISDPNSLSPIIQVQRSMLEAGASFDDTVKYLQTGKMCAPVYLTIAGPQPAQGVVITRSVNESLHPLWLNCGGETGWFTAVANYDPWLSQPPRDNRLGLLKDKLNSLGPDHGWNNEALWEALSVPHNSQSRGVLNSKTIWTSQMSSVYGTSNATIRDYVVDE